MTEPTTPPEPKPTEQNPPPKPEEPKPEESKPSVTFTPEQQAELDRRMAAARKAGEKDGERKTAEAAAEAQRQADEARALTEQEQKGEYEAAKTTLTAERDTARSERDTLKADVEKYETALAPLIAALEAEIPAEGKKDYQADAAALDRLTWLTNRKTLLADLKVISEDGATKTRLPVTPKPNGGGLTETDEAARKAHERQTLRTF